MRIQFLRILFIVLVIHNREPNNHIHAIIPIDIDSGKLLVSRGISLAAKENMENIMTLIVFVDWIFRFPHCGHEEPLIRPTPPR